MKKYLKIIIGLIFSFIGYFSMGNWGFLIFMIGAYLLISGLIKNKNEKDYYTSNNKLKKTVDKNTVLDKSKDSKNKDKYIGIFGIALFFLSLAGMKITAYSDYVLFSGFMDGFLLVILSLTGLVLSKRYLSILYNVKM
ncbi:hypothetical protein [Arcobacter sp.]|jgi:uncharacterized membrane protein YedE/YeeE|uniref:hypothetical protein n=1 Tax=Arcobacter sp. TaxID=1872629 RepID=UPI003C72CBA4|tara:strand:- start:393 stop:806 length:414 start_codon:yes stop_codon:yes gene_type:complete